MTITIRRMAEADLPEVLAIEERSFAAPWSAAMFIDELTVAPARYWIVAQGPDGVVGYAGMLAVGDVGHVLNLAVDPAVRRHGTAAALLAALLRRSRDLGLVELTLEVRPSNEAAICLYRSAGFIEVGRRPRYYADSGEDAILMTVSDPGAGRPRELLLAIESSCDETAAAVLADGTELLSSVVASQVDFHRRFGGVVPEIASRKHVEAIVGVVDEALEQAGITLRDLSALAITQGPGLMGALVVGLAYAKALAFVTGLPLVGVNHLEGHLFASALADPDAEPPLVALIVSGGHTSLVHVPAWGEYRTIGSTLDDATGEAFDKVAKAVGLGYPGGPALSALAVTGDPAAIAFPRAMLHSGTYDFSLSGLKTAVVTYVQAERTAGREIDLPDLAASFQAAVIDVQVAKSVRAAREFGVRTFVLGGGVAANPALREALRAALELVGVRLFVPPLDLCSDNAAMIAAAAHFRLSRGETLAMDAEAVADLRFG